MSVDLMTTPNTPFLQKIQKNIELHHEALHGSEPVNQVNDNIKDFNRVKELTDKITEKNKYYPNLHLSKTTWRSYLQNSKFDEFITNFDEAHLKNYVDKTNKLIIFKNLLSGRIFFTITDSIKDKNITKENLIFVVYNDGKNSKRIAKIVPLLNLEYSEFVDTAKVIKKDPSTSEGYTPLQRFRARANNNGPIKILYTPRHVSDDSDDSDSDDNDDDYEVPMKSRPSFVYKPSDESVDPEPSQQPPSDSYWPSFW